MRANLRTDAFPLRPNGPAQAPHGACPGTHQEGRSQLRVHKRRAPSSSKTCPLPQCANARAGRGSALIHFRLCDIPRRQARPREGRQQAQGHTAISPNSPPKFRQQAAASLPWPTSPILPTSRSDRGPPAHSVFSDPLPASPSLTHLLKLFPPPGMPDLPFGPSKLLPILQGLFKYHLL